MCNKIDVINLLEKYNILNDDATCLPAALIGILEVTPCKSKGKCLSLSSLVEYNTYYK